MTRRRYYHRSCHDLVITFFSANLPNLRPLCFRLNARWTRLPNSTGQPFWRLHLTAAFRQTGDFAQQLGLTHTTARGLRAWQLAEEFRLALERQAEEHHRLEEEKKRESRNLPSQAEKRRERRKRRQRP